jgi:hypothetical protein
VDGQSLLFFAGCSCSSAVLEGALFEMMADAL